MSTGERIPLAQAQEIAEDWLMKLGRFCDRIEVAGSIRRQKETVGDIEIVALPRLRDAVHIQNLIGPDFKLHMAKDERDRWAQVSNWGKPKTKERNDWVRTTALAVAGRIGKPVQFRGGWPGNMTQIALPERVVLDLFTPTREAFALILLIRTGSAEFSHTMMTQAACSGYISREGRIYRRGRQEGEAIPVGDPFDLPNEMAVFDLIGVRWVSPQDRLGAESVLLNLKSQPTKQFLDAVEEIRRKRA